MTCVLQCVWRVAWGVGRGAWGVGRGAWGVGRGACARTQMLYLAPTTMHTLPRLYVWQLVGSLASMLIDDSTNASVNSLLQPGALDAPSHPCWGAPPFPFVLILQGLRVLGDWAVHWKRARVCARSRLGRGDNVQCQHLGGQPAG